MDIDARIRRLEKYREDILAWNSSNDYEEKTNLRSLINKNKQAVKRDVLEAGCYKTVTIGPPPAVGGLVMNRVCAFDMIFNPPYLQSLVPVVMDMIDETIGVMSSEKFREKVMETVPPGVDKNVESGYVFVAMPIDSSDHALEDVLDSIKEACARCGLMAERVDEPPSNDRITDRILESIRRAEYVIVDLTYSKPNVFYEAGYAQGQGKTPIYIARDGMAIEFDLKDYPVIFFKNMKQLKDRLEERLRGLANKK